MPTAGASRDLHLHLLIARCSVHPRQAVLGLRHEEGRREQKENIPGTSNYLLVGAFALGLKEGGVL